jgi:membrane protein YqaA with SNARE-associated domain
MSFWHHFADTLLGWGPYGLLLLSLLDSVGLPVVGGVDSLLLAVAVQRPSQAYWSALCAIAGSLAGSMILFSIARKGGEVLLRKHTSGRTGARLHDWFHRYGLVTVFVPAVSPVPLPMKVPVFCAGALQVRLFYFVAVVLAARVIRYFGLAYIGQHYGKQAWHYIVQHAWAIGLGALAIGIAVAVTVRVFGDSARPEVKE